MHEDRWLERWLPFLAQFARPDSEILELGCGSGADTATLVGAGFKVSAVDVSADSIERAKRRVPDANFHQQDIREPFPIPPSGTPIIAASLCLHYFTWPETTELVSRLHETLGRPGLLLCRLNSTRDRHFGAEGHPRISDNYYRVDGQPKRFFDEASVRLLFQTGWRIQSLEEYATLKYDKPKTVWEAVVEAV